MRKWKASPVAATGFKGDVPQGLLGERVEDWPGEFETRRPTKSL